MIVDDDKPFLQRLARAMVTRGFEVSAAESVTEALTLIREEAPAFAVVDLRLGDGIGLDVIFALKKRRPDARIILLSGYGNIPTAVASLGIGAIDCLAKPADADDIVAALFAQNGGNGSGNNRDEQAYEPMFQRKFEECSERARIATTEKERVQLLDLANLIAEAQLHSKSGSSQW